MVWIKSRWAALVVLAFLVLFIGVTRVVATSFRGGQHVVIGAGEVIDDDLYIAAETVTIDGIVRGDIVATGRQVTLNGSAEGDFIACGQAVTINGRVGDDVRVAGMALRLGPESRIWDDVISAGFSLESEPGSVAEGTLVFAGYQALLAGAVREDLGVGTAGLDLRGTVGGNVDVEVDGDVTTPLAQFFPSPIPIPTVQSGLTVSESARVGGTLRYESSTQGCIDAAADIEGGITWEEREVTPAVARLQTSVLAYLPRPVTLMLLGLALLLIAPTWTQRLADSIQTRPLQSLSWGVVSLVAFLGVMIAVLAASGILAFGAGLLTLWGVVALAVGVALLTEGALAAGLWIGTAVIAPVVASFTAGRWLMKRIRPTRATGRVLPLLVGLLVFGVLLNVPLLGLLVGLVVALLGLGSLWIWASEATRRPLRQASPAS